ncbi:hypothetical protein KJ781_04355, partial [Patescibacteria group bacterium]|nr:hypothetical protein [Patescibacteria group bacterium]
MTRFIIIIDFFLACVLVCAHLLWPPIKADIELDLNRSTLARWHLESQYFNNAIHASPLFSLEPLAGNGIGLRRDGVGLWASFIEPVDMCWEPNNRYLLILDRGAGEIVKLDPLTRQVSTILDYNAALADIPSLANWTPEKLACGINKYYFTDSAGHFLISLTNNGINKISKPGGIHWDGISQISYLDGSLYILETGTNILWRLREQGTPPELIMSLNSFGYDSFSIVGNRIIFLSSSQGIWSLGDIKQRLIHRSGQLEKGWLGLASIDKNGHKFYCRKNNSLALLEIDNDGEYQLKLISLYNLDGIEIGNHSGPYAYRRMPYAELSSLAGSYEGHLYLLDKANKQITLYRAQYIPRYPQARNALGNLGPELQNNKNWGTNRIIWISHSVFWSPSGYLFDGDLAVGVPNLLQDWLNENSRTRWEVINLGITGAGFYTHAFSKLKKCIDNYGSDYVLLVLDLNNIHWFLQYNGFVVPARYDRKGAPIGVDTELAEKSVISRAFPEPIKPLAEHILKYYGPESALPLVDHNGTFAKNHTIDVWLSDSKFRYLLSELYSDFISHLDKLSKINNMPFVVALVPLSSFVASHDWTDPLGIGNPAGAFDFEKAHSDLLLALYKRGIKAYDLSYDMIARHAKYFPYDADSHHKSYLMHRAINDSLVNLIKKYNLFSMDPLPPRIANESGAIRTDLPNHILMDWHDKGLTILH